MAVRFLVDQAVSDCSATIVHCLGVFLLPSCIVWVSSCCQPFGLLLWKPLLSYVVLCCAVLWYAVLYCDILCYTAIYCNILCHFVICCCTLCYSVIRCVILWYAVLLCMFLTCSVPGWLHGQNCSPSALCGPAGLVHRWTPVYAGWQTRPGQLAVYCAQCLLKLFVT